ncbi:MAG: adenosylcobinamide-phosphate synthase CbiB [Actinomycetota bacterium]|nr:adenosylcobinamide-phosphate synthase CbiB [Actinomycetota bacterium]
MTARAGLLRVGGLACAVVADRRFGEPPAVWHPVVLFGRAMTAVEARMWADRRGPGAAFAAAGVALGGGTGVVLAGRPRRAGGGGAGRWGPRGRAVRRFAVLIGATYAAVAGRALGQAADDVDAALGRGDLEAARTLLRSLVGRETSGLDEAEIIRATVESVAENTVDAVTAPLLWAFVAAGPGVLAYRAVNTLDAMVGHRNPRYERFGWAAARIDDAANWIPARVTAALVAMVRPDRRVAVLEAVARQAPAHPSPNAGVAEAAFAGALGVRLGGVNDYGDRREDRPAMGAGGRPERRHIAEAVLLSRHVTMALLAAMAGLSLAAGRRR